MKYLDVPSSGSIADRTHSHNRAGQYTRNRRAPVQPIGTGRRAFIRSAFGNASTAWSGLSSAQQAAWGSYSDGHPITDSLGQSVKLTGHQMFVAIATQTQNCGAPLPTDPPVSDAIEPLGVPTFVADLSSGLTATWAVGVPGDFVLVAFSPPLSSGRTFTNVFWQASVNDANDGTSGNMLAAYTAQFGAPAAGRRIFVKITPVNSYGVTGTPAILRATVQA